MNDATLFDNLLTLKGYSKQTIRGYNSILKKVLIELPNIKSIGKNGIINYLSNKIKKNNYSGAYVAQFVSVINILLNDVYEIKERITIPRPKKATTQPDVLTVDEMQKLLNVITNIKHKAIIAVMYSTGLRANEACNLMVKDIDSVNGCINIRKGKGNKDRKAMLDESILLILRKYFLEYNPHGYLFVGAKGSEYSTRSVQQIVKNAAKKAGIKKNISSHSLRHSCFTQMVKNGVDIRYIQQLAGHKNINTTAQYLRLSNDDVLKLNSPIKSISL